MPQYHVDKQALAGKTILITGASDGIGKQAALSFAEYGANLVLLGRTQSKLDAVQATIQENAQLENSNIKVMCFCLDLNKATQADYKNLADNLSTQFNALDGVLHSAGLLGSIGPLCDTAIDEFNMVMNVNVTAQLLLTQAILPLVQQSKDGRIVFTTSTVGHVGRSGWGSYAISKFATEGMMQVLADECKDSTIRVNAINPGGTRTNMRASAFPNEDPNQLKTAKDIIPLYVYLMAPEGINEHGQCIDAQPK